MRTSAGSTLTSWEFFACWECGQLDTGWAATTVHAHSLPVCLLFLQALAATTAHVLLELTPTTVDSGSGAAEDSWARHAAAAPQDHCSPLTAEEGEGGARGQKRWVAAIANEDV